MAHVLVIDDEAVIRELIAEILTDAGHETAVAASAAEGLAHLAGDHVEVDVVVSDIVMPGLTGLELLEEVRRIRPNLPVVLVTGAGTHAMLTQALARGANGLVMKPFSHAELAAAVATALERSARAEHDLRDRLLTPSLASALANAIETRDSTMQGHCERLTRLAVRVALELGLSDAEVENVRLGAIVHDVGKIGIPDRVLIKHGPLTAEERALMETHPLIGDRLLAPLDLLDAVRPVVRHHHERWDGAGYPDRLSGTEIPIAARIVAVADAVEAMSGERPYRTPLKPQQIVAELEAGKSRQWDPALVEVVLGLIEDGELRFGRAGLALNSPGDPLPPEPALSIMLVDNDLEHALEAKEALEAGVEHAVVSHVADLAGALELCRGATWSAIVLDQSLPDGQSLEAVQMLRDLVPDVPVVMLTGEGSENLAVEAFRHGVADYVVKSDEFLDELAGRVQTLVNR